MGLGGKLGMVKRWGFGMGLGYLVYPKDLCLLEGPVSRNINKVSDLIDSNTRRKQDLILTTFNTNVANSILAIPLSRWGFQDRLIWSLNKTGEYSVKSGYAVFAGSNNTHGQAGSSTGTGHNNTAAAAFWRKVWSLKLPAKIVVFLWKCCSNILPTKTALRRRQIMVNSTCVLCGVEDESCSHLFLSCPFATRLWFASSLTLRMHNVENASVTDWFQQWFHLLKNNKQHADNILIEVAAVMWTIWRVRNKVCFENIKPLLSQAYEMYRVFTSQFHAANSWKNDLSCTPGLPIGYNRTLTNYDAGVIIRDQQGKGFSHKTSWLCCFDGAWKEDKTEAGIGVAIFDKDGSKRGLLAVPCKAQ